MKEVRLDNDISAVFTNVDNANISMYVDNVRTPIVRASDYISICKNNEEVVITQAPPKSKIHFKDCVISGSIISNNKNVNLSNCTLYNTIISGNNSILSNGKIIICDSDEEEQVEIIVPKRDQIDNCFLQSKFGDIAVEDLLFYELVAKTKSGNITLKDIDAVFARVKSKDGNIDIRILESIKNYKTYLESTYGSVRKSSREFRRATLLEELHELKAENYRGDIRVLFRGKK